jgi:7-cyano-7-deazaguanine synthase
MLIWEEVLMIAASSDRVMVLVSGGIDSSALCALLNKEGREVHGLFINRGQRALKNERAALERIKSRVGIERIHSAAFDISEWREGQDEVEKQQKGIPGRNMSMVALAIPYALQMDCSEICIGSLPHEFADSSEDFLRALDQAVRRLTNDGLVVRSPFIEKNWSKPNVMQWISRNLGNDFFNLCYSCYSGSDSGEHCGKCGGCENRKWSFKAAGIEDMTSYCNPAGSM